MKIRLDKYLADMSVGTRSEIKGMVKNGRVAVNDRIVKDSGSKIETTCDSVKIDGRTVDYQEWEYYMLHKPAGYLTAVTDSKEKTVMELLEHTARRDLFPVGRLDKDTTGLLLITNHGELSHRLLAPKSHVDKKYFARLDGILDEDMSRKLEEGVFIEKDVKTLPAKLEILSNVPDDVTVCLTIHEGRFHQVKKMFAAVGRQVIALKRLEFGTLKLDETLPEGKSRPLTEQEIEDLFICAGFTKKEK
jgi:16S rRNA pseudouridine516 synthase